uniref:Uncharacterized protein n=2 Tax=Lygus hesperus TaxID=30085 RepID=A0A0K8SKF9_LYGHE
MHDDSKQENLPSETALNDDAQSDNDDDVPNVGEYVTTSLQDESPASSDTTGRPTETNHSSLKGHRKRRREVLPQCDNAVASSPNETTNPKIPTCHHQHQQQLCSIFGQLVAEQLRQLSPKRRILTQGRLNAILQEALLEELEHPS